MSQLCSRESELASSDGKIDETIIKIAFETRLAQSISTQPFRT